MADISLLSRLVSGVQRQVDLSANTLVVGALKVGATTLSEAILGRLISLQNGSDVDATYHTHDGRYFTEAELSDATGPATGSDLIGDDDTYSNFTPSAATVKGALEGIDSALANVTTEFSDSLFRVVDNGDATKKLAFEVSAITTATTRTWTVPDANLNFSTSSGGSFANSALSNLGTTAVNAHLNPDSPNARNLGDSTNYWGQIYAATLNAGQVNSRVAGSNFTFATLSHTASGKVILQTGSASAGNSGDIEARSGTATGTRGKFLFDVSSIDAGSVKINNVSDPTAAQDAATKAYVDSLIDGRDWKQSVKAATTAAGTLASSFENGDSIDGVTLSTGDRILIKDQADPSENGIYIVAATGAPSRSSDADSAAELVGAAVFVEQGTANGDKQFAQTGDGGTFAINSVWVVTSANHFSGHDMITLSGGQISVDLAAVSGLESSNPGNAAGQLRIKLEASNPSLQINGSNELGAKLDAAGAILSGASGLAVQVDNSTIEISSNALRVKAAGINENHLAASVAGAGLTGGAGSALAVGAGDGITVNANDVAVNTTAIAGAGLENDGSNNLRIATGAYDQSTITGGGGSAAAVAFAPYANQNKKTMVAGEAFAANTSFLVRWAVNGETAGRVYKADKDASSVDKFWCVGIALSTGAVSAGQNIDVVFLGTHTLGSSDAAFGGTDIGKAVWLTAAGAFSVTAPSATNEAAFKIGTVESTTKIWVSPQMMGVN